MIPSVFVGCGCVGAGGEGVGAGGEGVGVTGDGVTAGGEVPSVAVGTAGKLALMNLLRAAPMSSGATSTSTPSSTPSATFLLGSGGVATCGGGTGGAASSCVTTWGFGGQKCAEPGRDDTVFPCGAAGVLGGPGEEVLPSLSFPLLTSPPMLTLLLRILLNTPDC